MSLESILVAFGLCLPSGGEAPVFYGEFRVVEEFYVDRDEEGLLRVEASRSSDIEEVTNPYALVDFFEDHVGDHIYRFELESLHWEGEEGCEARMDFGTYMPLFVSDRDLGDIDMIVYLPFS